MRVEDEEVVGGWDGDEVLAEVFAEMPGLVVAVLAPECGLCLVFYKKEKLTLMKS